MLIHYFDTVARGIKNSIAFVSIFGVLAVVFALNTAVADTTVQLNSGEGFVVHDSTGSNERLRVQETGQVSLPAVPTATSQAQGVCISSGGLLGPCSGSIGGAISGSGTVNYLSKWTPNGSTLGNSAIYENNGLVGFGTNALFHNFEILGASPQINIKDSVSGQTALLSRYLGRFEISPSDGFQVSVGSVGLSHFWVGLNGNVGIGTTAPNNKLQIGSIGAAPFSGNDIAFGNGVQSSAIAQTPTVAWWYANATNISLMPNSGIGYVGINTTTPASKLQIGSVGATGYGGDDIAFGNGIQASGIAQTASVAQWYSTTDIALMPRGNGAGMVGINTTSPQAPLDVQSYLPLAIGAGTYHYFRFSTADYCTSCTANVSIRAADNVAALEFDAFSDARIKDIVGVSNSSKDLDTVNALQVTDYTLKDKVKNGDKPFKKVIAQQVETVYPQVVSKHVDFIPNVYQAASSVTKTAAGYLLHFENGHHLSGQAKRINLMASNDNTMQRAAIVSIPSDRDVVIELTQVNGDNVFVFGEEVDDFRTVDYEGLTTLNISATQELSKRLAALVAEKDALKADNDRLKERLDRMEKLLASVVSRVGN